MMTPQDVRELTRLHNKADTHISKIDNQLREHALVGFPTQLRISIDDTEDVVEHLYQRYARVGWNVSVDETQIIFNLPEIQ